MMKMHKANIKHIAHLIISCVIIAFLSLVFVSNAILAVESLL